MPRLFNLGPLMASIRIEPVRSHSKAALTAGESHADQAQAISTFERGGAGSGALPRLPGLDSNPPLRGCGKGAREFTRVEAAHTGALGPRGLGQKSSDFSAIPLCSWDHVGGPDSYHRLGERSFAENSQIDLPALGVGA